MNTYLKAKITLPITGSRVENEGSITLDEDIMDMLGVKSYEQVFVNNKYRESRIMTYLLPGERGTEICEANGGAAKFFKKGDIVHLLFFTVSDYYAPPIIHELK